MKKIGFGMLILLFTILIQSRSMVVLADEIVNDAVYFGSYTCLICQELENSGVLEEIQEEGYTLKKYMAEDDYDLFQSMFSRYARTYDVPRDQNLVPILYVGNTYYIGLTAIKNVVESGEVYEIMDTTPLLEPVELIYGDITFRDLLLLIGSTILLGFLDAFNPCALAMLLMFLSFLTDKKRTKTIAWICFYYILAVFTTYFILGTALQSALSLLVPYMRIFYIIIITLALLIAALNFLDFFATRRKDYGKIKNQLPKRIFVVTRKLMQGFSDKVETGAHSIYFSAFLIGVFVAMIEFPCSGQAFVAWTAIVVDRTAYQLVFMILLFFYVLLFVAPLIVISVIGLKSKNVPVISNFIRERLDVIKLMNALVFLGVALYYIFKVFL